MGLIRRSPHPGLLAAAAAAWITGPSPLMTKGWGFFLGRNGHEAREQGRADHRRRLRHGRQHGADLRPRGRQGRRRRLLDEEGKEVVAEITKANGAAMFRHLDVTSEAEWKAAVDATLAEFGKLDILVNDAGLSGSAVEDLFDTAAWDRLMAVNARGVFLGMKFAIPLMKAAGGGSIVNISSISGITGQHASTSPTTPRKARSAP